MSAFKWRVYRKRRCEPYRPRANRNASLDASRIAAGQVRG